MFHRGYGISVQKISLLAVTAVVTIYCWLALPFPVALLILNLSHAIQYFAIVWWAEKRNLTRLLDPEGGRPALAFFRLVLITACYGLIMRLGTGHVFLSVYVILGLLHFWYDGFIWSVR